MGGQAVSGWPFTVTYVEVPFEVPLTTVDGVEVLFVGRMDVVGEYLGGYVVVDHKTTGFINSMWTDQWAMDGQVVSGWPFTVTYVEVPFEVPLTTVDGVEVLFVGRMDVVGG